MFAQLKTVEYIYSLIKSWERVAAHTEDDPMQPLLLGLNAYINHDLVFELAPLLKEQDDALTPEERRRDRHDFDALIDEIKCIVLDAHKRVLALGIPLELDAWLIEDLLDGWSETVWKHVDALLRSHSEFETEAIRFQIDRRTVRRAEAIRCARLGKHTPQIA